jgi:hypothetical protein
VNPAAVAARLSAPALFISYLSGDNLDYKSTGLVYERCASARKEWIVFRKDYTESEPGERKKYFDKVAAFIQAHLPKPIRKGSRYKKLVGRPGGPGPEA